MSKPQIKPFRLPQYTFGCEIECIGGREVGRSDVRRATQDAGFSIAGGEGHGNYNDRTWTIGYDGSLEGNNCMEIKSPILKGAAGLMSIRKFTKVLADLGVGVNRSCGLHVHIGIANAKNRFAADEVLTILKRYTALKPQIDLLLARSRRDGENEYCGAFPDVVRNVERLIQSGDVRANRKLNEDSISLLAEQGDHYDAVSIQALDNYGTIEFRQHHGTVNGGKITNWIRFLLSFIEMSRLITNADRQRHAARAKESNRGRLKVRRALAPKREVKIILPETDELFAGQTPGVVRHFLAQKERLAARSARR